MTTPSLCLNCGARIAGKYCSECGQRVHGIDVTLREFVRESTHELLNWDGRIPRTLRALILEPGKLTTEFLSGRRANWLRPLRIYLVCSVGYFIAVPLMESVTGLPGRNVLGFSVTNPDGTTPLRPEVRAQMENGLPARIFGIERLERASANQSALNRAARTALPKAMFVLLPLFAFLTSIVWRRQGWHYPAHLYGALHLHAAIYAALAAATVIASLMADTVLATIVRLALLVYVPWYTLVAQRRVFGDPWLMTTLKTGVVGVLYLFCVFLCSIGILAYALATMSNGAGSS